MKSIPLKMAAYDWTSIKADISEEHFLPLRLLSYTNDVALQTSHAAAQISPAPCTATWTSC